MLLSFRMLIIAVVILGAGLGVAFGAGVAYGRGDPKTVQSGLTQQQIQSLLGITGNTAGGGGAGGATGGSGASGATGSTGTNRGGGNNGAGAATGSTAATGAAARSTTGRITAVQGTTITIETRTGAQQVNLGNTTTISKLSAGAMADLKEGTTIIANGTRKDDGSFDATEVSQVPSDVTALVAGTTGGTTPGGR